MENKNFIPGKFDTPEITSQLHKVEALAVGDRVLKYTQMQQCQMNDKPTFDRTQKVEPIQLFDNLYFIGGTEIGCFIFKTTEGLIMIDSCFYHDVEPVLLAGMKKLGLDPAQVKYMLITHCGPDHIGGGYYFQKNFGTKIVTTAEEKKNAPSPQVSAARLAAMGEPGFEYNPFDLRQLPFPDIDIVAEDGDKITLGDTEIQIVKCPRRVGGGGLSYLTAVYDHGTPHMWCTYGNTGVVGALEDMDVYRASVMHFVKYADQMGADVIISSHPFVDDSIQTMEQLRSRQEGDPHPFVYGKEKVRQFFEILYQSSVVTSMRRALGLNGSGSGPYVPGVMDQANGTFNAEAKRG